MNLVTLDGIHKQYSERLLLDGVDMRINSGERIGLIGVNGSGKTTLLRIVAGLERPDEGVATVWGGVRITYLPQEPVLDPQHTVLQAVYAGDAPLLKLLRDYALLGRELAIDPDDPALLERFHASVQDLDSAGGQGWAAEAEAKAVLDRLGIEDVDALVGTLSGGQQKRVALARALVDPADLLVLDEPTNHLDAETLAWLEAYLLRGERALLMVTHDRYFLDRVVGRIVELDRRQLVNYPGSYTRYLEARSERHERLAKGEEDQRRHLKRELEWLRRGAKARSTKQKARSQRVEELQRIAYDSGEERVALALGSRRLGKNVLTAEGLSKTFDGRTVGAEPERAHPRGAKHDRDPEDTPRSVSPASEIEHPHGVDDHGVDDNRADEDIVRVLDGVDLTLGPGDRIGIVGPNGAGKSTLLDVLAGRIAADSGSVNWGETVALGYFDQRSAELKDDMKVIDYIEQEAPLIRTDEGERISASRMLEWLLFPGPQQHALIGSLSGGERRRLYLLRTLIHRPNVLLLDEPTNDLDIETLGVIESFLDAFEGTLIVVSHDRYFLDRTVDQLAVLEDGRLHAGYPTPFSSFLRVREEQRAAAIAMAAIGKEGSGKSAIGKDAGGKEANGMSTRIADSVSAVEGAAGVPARGSHVGHSSARKSGSNPSSTGSVGDAEPSRSRVEARQTVVPRKLSFKEAREFEALSAKIETDESRKSRLQVELNSAGGDFERIQVLADELSMLETELDADLERWLELSEIAEAWEGGRAG